MESEGRDKGSTFTFTMKMAMVNRTEAQKNIGVMSNIQKVLRPRKMKDAF